MKSNQLILIGAGLVAFLYMRRQAAPLAMAGTGSTIQPTQSLQNQMWTSIYGNAWTDALAATGAALGVIGKNSAGQLVTADGKAVDAGAYDASPSTYGQEWGGDLSMPDANLMGAFYA